MTNNDGRLCDVCVCRLKRGFETFSKAYVFNVEDVNVLLVKYGGCLYCCKPCERSMAKRELRKSI
jgi:hypothetical protein